MLEVLNSYPSGKILIDLRGNPGGLLPGGIDCASLFLKSGDVIVSQVDKTLVKRTEKALFDGEFSDPEKYQVAILADENTASAAEVFTAALIENGRATLTTVGSEHTFGKGIVQTVRPLDGENVGGIKVTVSKYLTPEGTEINGKGIMNDAGRRESCGEEGFSCLDEKAWMKK